MKVCLIFLIAFCVHSSTSAKQDEAEDITPIVLDFLSHVPFSKLLRTIRKYSEDAEVQDAIIFLTSDEFKDTWEDVKEYLNVCMCNIYVIMLNKKYHPSIFHSTFPARDYHISTFLIHTLCYHHRFHLIKLYLKLIQLCHIVGVN